MPHDRSDSFDPQLIGIYQRRFPGFDDKFILMYARGMSIREITRHLRDLYGIDVSPDLISAVTDAVLKEVAAWQQHPLDPACAQVFFDTFGPRSAMKAWSGTAQAADDPMIQGIIPKPSHHYRAGLRADGNNEVLGLWNEQNEGAKALLSMSKGSSRAS